MATLVTLPAGSASLGAGVVARASVNHLGS
jgi:hypothetical protein